LQDNGVMRVASSCPQDPADLMPALIGIRIPLALWVVSHHLSGPGRMFHTLTGANATVQAVIDAAWVALSVFFAISGFVLARRYHTTRWNRSALARYAVARFGRVYPVYLFSLLILVPIIVEAMRGDDLGSVRDRIGLIVNHVLLLQGWQRPAVNWNTPAWSLSSEVFFYALFPLVILLVRHATWPRLLAAAGLAFAMPIALRLLLEPPIMKPLLYLGDFVIGVVAGRIYDRLRTVDVPFARVGPWLYGPAFAGGLLLLVYRDQLGSFLLFDSGVRFVSALLVFGLACGGGPLWRVLSSPLMVGGGRASYAVYILHVPVLWWYERSALRAALPPLTAGVIYVVMVVALSAVVSRFVEEPANAIIRRWFAGRRSRRATMTPVADVGLSAQGHAHEG
jgi:peptidoglycan/LPS O-acetylase OafA/YrhL